MRAELPWNVAGIPPEAREAARAAARREGLSVGEWLTRRILQSFSGLEEEAGSGLDSWGLPASTVSRHDSEEMLARVGRSESESNDSWRRIENQLRGLGQRLESSERTHSESNRVLSRTAQEINISAREQAVALEQLGHNIAGLNERLERLERGGPSDNLREAVKALHLGLSRLAEQIASTTSHSTTQLAQVTDNLEKLAGHVGQIWEDADSSAQLLERRIDVSEQGLAQRIANAERAIEARVAAVEKIAQFNHNALDHALERLEASDDQRVADEAESQRRASLQDENVRQLQDSIARVESLLPVPELDQRLGSVERSVQDLADRFEQDDPAERFDAAMQALSHRLEKVETSTAFEAPLQVISQRLEKLETAPPAVSREDIAAPVQELSQRLEKLETAPPAFSREDFEEPLQELAQRLEKLEKVHAELLAELHAKPSVPPSPEPPEPVEPTASNAFESATESEAPPFELPAHEPPAYQPPPVTLAALDEQSDSFSPPPAFAFDSPAETSPDKTESFTPDFDDVFEEPVFEEPLFEGRSGDQAGADSENFLAQARRSARDASEKAENEGRDRLSSFRSNPNEAAAGEKEEKDRPRYLIPILVVLLVLAAAAAAFVLSQRARTTVLPALPAPKPATTVSKAPLPVQPDGNQTKVATASQADGETMAGAGALDFSSQRSEPAASDVTPPTLPATASPSQVAAPQTPAPQTTVSVSQTAPAKPVTASAAPAKPGVTASAPPAKPPGITPAAKPAPASPAPAKPVTASAAPAKPVPASPAPAKAANPIERVIKLANAGNPTALTVLGLRAVDGTDGTPVNLPDAVKFLTQAAEKGQAVAQYRLGTLYERGQGIAADGVKAVHWYGLAAAQGNRKAMHNLAVAYASGIGGKKNMAEAARWFAKAASLGLSDSQFNLAVLYERGDGVPQSLVDAYKWYSIAGATGDAESKARMAVLQTQLSDADKAAANRSVGSFRATPLSRIANVPPEPADLGN